MTEPQDHVESAVPDPVVDQLEHGVEMLDVAADVTARYIQQQLGGQGAGGPPVTAGAPVIRSKEDYDQAHTIDRAFFTAPPKRVDVLCLPGGKCNLKWTRQEHLVMNWLMCRDLYSNGIFGFHSGDSKDPDQPFQYHIACWESYFSSSLEHKGKSYHTSPKRHKNAEKN